MNVQPIQSDGLVGKRISIKKDRGSFFYSYTGTCLACYIEPNPMGGDGFGAAVHVLCDDGQVRNLHAYPNHVEILVIPDDSSARVN